MTVFAYYRVSTDHQDYESQRIGVLDYARRAGLTIDKEFLDNGVSGAIIAQKRNLGKLLREMKDNDTIITAELSRLGRSAVDVIKTCETISKKNVNCYLVKQAMQIDNTPMGKLMTAILSAFSEMERDLISQRTKEGMARRKAAGKQIGRQRGTKNATHKLDGKHQKIVNLLKEGMSKRQIARRTHVSPPTISRFIQTNPALFVA